MAQLVTKRWVEQELEFVLARIDENMKEFSDAFPSPSSENLMYEAWENVEWTPGFWTGMIWLAYEYTGKKRYLDGVERLMPTFERRLIENTTLDTHDIGFIYSLSAMAGYCLRGKGEDRQLVVQAANRLLERYSCKTGIIQAWGDLSNPDQQGRMIIDCLLNLPLLYDATSLTGDERYYQAALSHSRQAGKYLVRADFSTYHTFYMDPETGKPLKGKTAQGYSDDSPWARGQAWAVYGFVVSYVHTGKDEFLRLAKRTADYFIQRLPIDGVPYWDLTFQEGNQYRDSSAGAILACGLLELAKNLPLSSSKRATYEKTAVKIVKTLADTYTTKKDQSNGVLKHGVYSIPHGNGVDECVIWGDYFYMESLIRLVKAWEMYW